jgi:hypothetical protein
LLAPLVRLGLAPLAGLAGRSSARRLVTREARSTPLSELRRTVRKRALHRTGAPVVAGPWLQDEVGELLYWIPFLRWVQALSPGLHERLFVVCRRSSAAWYAGIGAGRIDVEQLTGSASLPDALAEDELQGPLRDRVAAAFGLGSRAFRVLPERLVTATRAELAHQSPAARAGRRLLEFALLPPTEPPTGLELPDDFVAVRFAVDQTELADAFADWQPAIRLEGFDGAAQAAVVARARGFVGTFGVEAVLAVLSGVPAVAFDSRPQQPVEDDLRLVSSFLADPPFGHLHVLDVTGSPAEAAKQAGRLLEAPVEALAAV